MEGGKEEGRREGWKEMRRREGRREGGKRRGRERKEEENKSLILTYVPKIHFLMYCIQWFSVLLVLPVLIPVFLVFQNNTGITCQYSTSIPPVLLASILPVLLVLFLFYIPVLH